MSRPPARTLHVAEPPPSFMFRPPLVVDCSVLSAVLFEEEARDEALQLLSGRTLHAPTILDHEIVSVAIKKSRGGWPEAAVELALADYWQQAIDLHRVDAVMQHQLGIKYKLSAYDASYLLLAAALKVPLVTFDAKLAAAARTHLANLH